MPDKKLTDSEIVKVLECFVNEECPDCERCSYYDYCRKNRVYIDVFDLINRLQVENKRLSTLAELGNTRANDYRVMRDRALKAEAENEKLQKFKAYFDFYYGSNIEILGIDENGDTTSFDEFYNCAIANAEDIEHHIAHIIKTAKAKAVAEFVEMLKEYVFRADSHKDGFEHDVVDIDDVYNLLKELVGAERTGTFPTINNELGEDDE